MMAELHLPGGRLWVGRGGGRGGEREGEGGREGGSETHDCIPTCHVHSRSWMLLSGFLSTGPQ